METYFALHNRMAVMLSDNDTLAWINTNELSHALSLLKPFPAELMDGYDVSELVNDPQNDLAECIDPVLDYNHQRKNLP